MNWRKYLRPFSYIRELEEETFLLSLLNDSLLDEVNLLEEKLDARPALRLATEGDNK